MIDLIIIAAVAYGCIRGLMKGLVREVASFVGVFVAIIIARAYYLNFTVNIQFWFDLSPNYAKPIAFVIIFLAVAIVCHLIAIVIDKLLKIIALDWLNKLAGAVFGILKVLLILSIFFNAFQSFTGKIAIFPTEAVEKSVLYLPVKSISSVFISFAEKNCII